MEEKKESFFQDHSLTFIEMALSTHRTERPAHPDGYGKRTGECGDTVEMFLTCKGDIIEAVSFHVQGCMNTTACSNAGACLAEGRPLDEAWDITPQKIAAFLQTLPEDHFHCAELALGALYKALSDIRNPDKGMIRTPVTETHRPGGRSGKQDQRNHVGLKI